MEKKIETDSEMNPWKEEKNTTESIQVDDEYMYFQPERLRDGVEISHKVETAAWKLIHEKEIVLEEVNFRYTEDGLEGIAYAVVPKKQHALVLMQFDRQGIQSVQCDVPYCDTDYDWPHAYGYAWEYKKNLCVHEAALLFLVQNYLRINRPGDATDFYGYVMMQSFRNIRRGGIAQLLPDVQPFRLEPRLEKQYDVLHLSFRLGQEKLLVVKNLSDLVEAVESNESMKFGTKTMYSFAGCTWEEKSWQYYQFIRDCVRQEQERSEYFYQSMRYFEESDPIKASIPLFGSRLDQFYSLCEGLTVECTDKTRDGWGKRKVTLCQKDPSVQLSIRKNVDTEGIFQGIWVNGSFPELFHGTEYYYYLEDTFLCRLGQEMATQLAPFIQMRSPEVQFQVGRRNLSEFFYRVLPGIQDFVTVRWKDQELIESYLPPEVKFQFYIDYENRQVACQPKAVYGDVSFSLTDHYQKHVVKVSFREYEREQDAIEILQKYFTGIQVADQSFYTQEEEDVFQLLEHGLHELMEIGEVHLTDSVRGLMLGRKPKIKVGVSVESSLMNLTIGSEDLSREELLELLASYQKKKKYYRLKSGQFLSLANREYEEMAQMVDALHITKKELLEDNIHLPAYRALYLDQMLEQNEQLYAKRDHHFKQLIKDFKTVRDSEYEVPESLQEVLRNYQTYGFRWLKTMEQYGFGGILADDMGLGKTLQVITLLLSAREAGRLKTSLIVAPASLVYNWKEEFLKFAPQIAVCVLNGNQKERMEILADWQQWDVLITSYDLLKRDIAWYDQKCFQYQIIDEAQYIKNHGTAAAKAIKVIQSRVRIALTGTPIENRLSELWSIFDYLMPGFLYGYDTFRKELEIPIVKNQDEEAMQKLKRMVSPFILRRLKTEVLQELPEKLEEVQYVKLSNQQQKLYDAQVTHMLSMLRGESAESYQKNKLKILAEITKIRQICCDPSLLFESYHGESAKCDACLDLIQSALAGGHKMLVFSQFTSMLEILEQRLADDKISYYKITGTTPKEKRLELVNQFNENEVPVFLISLRAGGTGLNLTGADLVIHYDPWWNVAAQNQATDRAHRIGQKKTVSVVKLIVKDSIEEKILHMQEAKQNLADEILNSDGGSLMSMTKEELMKLLES